MLKRVLTVLLVSAVVATACSDDSDSGSDSTPTTTAAVPDDTGPDNGGDPEASDPVTGPASIAADDQSGDGTSVIVASVTLPTDGFVVIHGDNDGSPGAILGWSDLLPAGDSADVVVTLGTAIGATATVFPMAHVDANGNGEYEFMPPDVTTDVPAVTADGNVAVLSIAYEVTAAGDEAALALSSSSLGDILVDAAGNTVYLFTPDAQRESACYDACEETWPVVGEITSVGEGLDAVLLGTTVRTNGDVQATYNSWPLYHFSGDAAPGDTNGHTLNAVWFVIDADGNAIGG